jgi:hypothetical protein
MRKRLTLTVLAAALAGCANGPVSTAAMLTYETAPEGATLFEAGQALGPAPVTRTYAHDGKSEAIHTPEVTAVWPSGARQTFWTLLPPGADRVATLQRPPGAPGLQDDLDNAKKFALQRERDADRTKADRARDLARDSARCRAQMAKGVAAPVDDCH